MKDIVAFIVFYMVWNSEIHEQHPILVPVLMVSYIVIMVLEFKWEFSKKK
jgi:hypothetical protein